MIDGPRRPVAQRASGAPSGLEPFIRWALIWSADPDTRRLTRDPEGLVVLRFFDGGESCGFAHNSAAIFPPRPRLYAIHGRGSLKPARAQTGSTPTVTWG